MLLFKPPLLQLEANVILDVLLFVSFENCHVT